jgi:hypothetical protein
MLGWGPWEWLTYALIAVAAMIPAIGAALSADPNLAKRTARVTGNVVWRIAPAAAIVASGILIVANQLGWTKAPPSATPQVIVRVVHVPTPDPAQAAKIASLEDELRRIRGRKGARVPHTAKSVGDYSTSGPNIDPCIPERNADRTIIEGLVSEAKRDQAAFVQSNDPAAISTAFTIWRVKADKALRQMTDKNVDVDEFDAAAGDPFERAPVGLDQAGVSVWREYAARIALLDDIDKNLAVELCPAELVERLREGKF